MILLSKLAEKSFDEKKKGGKKFFSAGAPGIHKKLQSNRFALANKLIIKKLRG